MTPTELLERFPFDPAKAHLHENYDLPRKLIAIEDERLRELAAAGWLNSKAGREWVERDEYAHSVADNSEERYP